MNGMAEAESDCPEQALNDVERVPSMTFWEKVGFSWFPSLWALIAAPLLLLFAFYFFTLALALLRHPHLFKQGGASWLLFLAASCIVLGAILVYPVRFFRRMWIRKRKTRSLFPSGEDLLAFRFRREYRREHPPVWMRVYVFSFSCLIAFGVTRSVIMNPPGRAFVAWGVPALFWLIAIVGTVDSVWPRRSRLWTGFVLSGSLGVLAILTVIAVIRYGDHKAYDWFFPLVFALPSGFFAVATVRDGKKRSA